MEGDNGVGGNALELLEQIRKIQAGQGQEEEKKPTPERPSPAPFEEYIYPTTIQATYTVGLGSEELQAISGELEQYEKWFDNFKIVGSGMSGNSIDGFGYEPP